MKKLFFILALFALSKKNSAQEVTVSLVHNGASTMYYGTTALSDAITNSINGDTIYAPGTAVFSAINIDKSIALFGPGVSPDSTSATGKCIVNGVTFSTGATNAWLEGFYINGEVYFSADNKTDGVRLTRNHLTASITFQASSAPLKDNLVIIEENVIAGNINCDGSTNVSIQNNIIGGVIQNIINNGLIANNVLHYYAQGWWFARPLHNVNNSLIVNNIFLNSTEANHFVLGSFNQVQNNIIPSATAENSTDNFFSNNYYSVNTATLFVGQSAAYSFFNYTDNYNLSTPATYPGWNNLGVGIYGGTYPWKTHIVPKNPHISSKSISGTTDTNGDININIKVKAQNN